MNPRRVALIGTGAIANSHVEALAHEPRAELVAAVDINPDAVTAFAETHRLEGHTDVAAMLGAAKPDLVHICTPPQLHAALSIQCMEAGAWVLCEKPLAASLREIDAIAAAEKRTGCYTSSVYQ